jgi:hypothetical protein
MTDDEDINITNEISKVDSWKPYDFLTFVENEMSLRGREYQITDLPADLGAMKTCVVYAEKCGKSRYEVVKFLLWALDGVTDERLTSLQFLTSCLRKFFGETREPETEKKRKRQEIELSPEMTRWLDELRAQGAPDLGMDIR